MNADEKYVVVQNGQRVTGLLSEEEAKAEAAKRLKAINEKAGDAGAKPKVEVKTNLFG